MRDRIANVNIAVASRSQKRPHRKACFSLCIMAIRIATPSTNIAAPTNEARVLTESSSPVTANNPTATSG